MDHLPKSPWLFRNHDDVGEQCGDEGHDDLGSADDDDSGDGDGSDDDNSNIANGVKVTI